MNSSHDQLEAVIEKIRSVRNFDFRNYKRATLRRRIEKRMTERGCKTHRDYLELLERKPEEYDALLSALLIKVTSFFRDPEAWDVLRKKVIPEMLASKRPGDEIRIWSAGCATGEETYSTAILLAEALGPAITNYSIKIFGTDVDDAAIASARRGVYPQSALESLSKERVARWFTRNSEGCAVHKELRRLVVFGVNNLVSDAPISRLDLLLCRNVFIYLDSNLQKRVLSRFHYALRPGGILFLGKSELIPFAAKVFAPVDLSRRIYRRGDRLEQSVLTEERVIGMLEQEDVARAVRQTREELSAIGEFHRDAFNSISVPVIGASLEGVVNLWNAAAARLWRRPESEVVGKKLASLGLPGLPGDLLIEKTAAVREGKTERRVGEGVVPDTDTGEVRLEVEVLPLHDAANELTGVIYVARDATALGRVREELRVARDDRERAVEDLETANEELQSSNEELETTNEELQSANEELQTTNEELQSANEELQTTNEELQSTNEELETTNEELQSTNAELDATNRELAHRTEELSVLSFYQRSIIRSLSAAVIVLDPQGRITLWNLGAERLLGLTEGEALGQLLWTLRIPVITRTIVKAMRKNLAKQLALRVEDVTYERAGGARGHAALSAVPLVDEDKRFLGSVVLVEDTTRAVLLAEERLREHEEGTARTGRGA